VRVRFTPAAREQFLGAVTHILSDNPVAAPSFRRRVERTLRRLVRFPQSGRLIPEFPDLPFREVVVPPYRFFYRVQARTVWVVAVWHDARLPAEPDE
jgi:toxin ParE1/3/4